MEGDMVPYVKYCNATECRYNDEGMCDWDTVIILPEGICSRYVSKEVKHEIQGQTT